MFAPAPIPDSPRRTPSDAPPATAARASSSELRGSPRIAEPGAVMGGESFDPGDALRERVVAAVGHQYALEGEIGRGGMSVVYRARDPRLNRPVAIKVLPPELAYDPGVRVRFTREAQ